MIPVAVSAIQNLASLAQPESRRQAIAGKQRTLRGRARGLQALYVLFSLAAALALVWALLPVWPTLPLWFKTVCCVLVLLATLKVFNLRIRLPRWAAGRKQADPAAAFLRSIPVQTWEGLCKPPAPRRVPYALTLWPNRTEPAASANVALAYGLPCLEQLFWHSEQGAKADHCLRSELWAAAFLTILFALEGLGHLVPNLDPGSSLLQLFLIPCSLGWAANAISSVQWYLSVRLAILERLTELLEPSSADQRA
jgi:hypothetical protein